MAFGACHVRTAILSPSPRAWPFNVGRSRYADRLRPNFLFEGPNPHLIRRAYALRNDGRGINLHDGRGINLQRHSAAAPHYSVAWRSLGLRSRWRALRPKNSAWLTTAETTATWKGFAIRKAGSGRCPVRKRSG